MISAGAWQVSGMAGVAPIFLGGGVESRGVRGASIVSSTVRMWRCFALCWSCGAEVRPQGATRSEVERPMHWFCPGCDVRWFAYADRVEMPTQALAS